MYEDYNAGLKQNVQMTSQNENRTSSLRKSNSYSIVGVVDIKEMYVIF